MGQGLCKASPTKDPITDDFYQFPLEALSPNEFRLAVSELYHFPCGFNASIRRIRPLHRVAAH